MMAESVENIGLTSALDMAGLKKLMSDEIGMYLDSKEDSLWRKGQEGIANMEGSSLERFQAAMDMMQRFQVTQDSLIAENERMKQTINDLRLQIDKAEKKVEVDAYSGMWQMDYGQISPRSWLAMSTSGLDSSAWDNYNHYYQDYVPYPEHALSGDLTGYDSSAKRLSGHSYPVETSSDYSAGVRALTGQLPSDISAPLPSEVPIPKSLAGTPPVMAVQGTSVRSFDVVIIRPDASGLGLGIAHDDAQVMVVDTIEKDGVVDRWNQSQTLAGGDCIQKGDEIVRVNAVRGGVQQMLEACRGETALNMTIHRKL